MKTSLPYLRENQIFARMPHRPRQTFILPSDLYVMTDGDTISVMAKKRDKDGKREAFRIRFSAVNAPEKPKRADSDAIFKQIGIDPNAGSPGQDAHNLMNSVTRGRAIMIIPQIDEAGGPKLDRYGRLIAEVIVSGAPGKKFDVDGAKSLEWILIDNGLGSVMPGRDLPERVPLILNRLQEEVEQERATSFHSPIPEM